MRFRLKKLWTCWKICWIKIHLNLFFVSSFFLLYCRFLRHIKSFFMFIIIIKTCRIFYHFGWLFFFHLVVNHDFLRYHRLDFFYNNIKTYTNIIIVCLSFNLMYNITGIFSALIENCVIFIFLIIEKIKIIFLPFW